MKRKIEQLTAIILCAAMLLSVLPMSAFAADERKVIDSGFCGAEGENVSWTLYDDGELVISGEGKMEWYELNSARNRKLPGWFEHYDKIDVITVEEGVTEIGPDAFSAGDKEKGYSPVSYYKLSLPKSLEYFTDFSFDENRIPGRHLAVCYAGSEEEWNNVWGTFSAGRYMGIYFNGEEPDAFCELVETYGEIDVVTHYYTSDPEAAKIEWYTINRGEATKVGETSAKQAEATDIEIPDYKRGEVYLQAKIIDADGTVIVSSQELYIGKNPTAIDYIKYYFQAAVGNLQFLGFWIRVILHMIPELFRMMIRDIIG